VTDPRFAAPGAPVAEAPPAADAPVEYVGFWARVGAALIDTVLMGVLFIPLSQFFLSARARSSPFGDMSFSSLTLNWILPAIVILVFWFARGATPGKMAISAVIVDADTLQPPSQGQFMIRYLGYYVSTMGLLLGLLWVGFDKRKQGWHDKMASTVVIRRRR
jgi:uncharacterized RDD family membrane protein YckC